MGRVARPEEKRQSVGNVSLSVGVEEVERRGM